MPWDIPLDFVLDEWKMLQLDEEPLVLQVQVGERINHFWNHRFKKKNEMGSPKYPLLTQLIKACLAVSHGSADVERSFSTSGRILTDEKARMSVETLNARLNITDALKEYKNKPELVPITKDLLSMARLAYKSYTNCLEEKKRLKEAEVKNQQDLERFAKEQEAITHAQSSKQEIKDLEENLRNVKREQLSKQKISDSLLDEANKRLKSAVHKRNLQEVELAQIMLETVQMKIDEERKLDATKNNINTNINKRKASIIDHFTYVLKNNFFLKHQQMHL